jgi:hypothetical protein
MTRALVAALLTALVMGSAPAGAASRIDRLAAAARHRYGEEVHGLVVHEEMRVIARDHGLRRLLASGNAGALRSYVRGRFDHVWYHQHASRLRLVRGSRVLVDVGVPFVVAPAQARLHTASGRYLATLQVSIQDVIGFVRYMHRNFGVDVVVRGHGAAHVKTSLPAALHVRLPRAGSVTIAGRRYGVRSFTQAALGGERVRVWVLH